MKYLCMVFFDEKRLDALSDAMGDSILLELIMHNLAIRVGARQRRLFRQLDRHCRWKRRRNPEWEQSDTVRAWLCGPLTKCIASVIPMPGL